jgi:hypothetical protein
MNLIAPSAFTDHCNRMWVLAEILVTRHLTTHQAHECVFNPLRQVADNAEVRSTRTRGAGAGEPLVARAALRPWKSDFQ